MDREQIGRLLAEAHKLTSHREYVIVGSLSILGATASPPADMVHSIDVDLYPRQDPGRAEEIARALGLGTDFEQENGYYADAVSPSLPTLPDDWESRLRRVDYPDNIVALYLDPNDAAVSKYARLEPRDREWIREGIKAGILDTKVIAERMKSATFLDQAEADRAKHALMQDRMAYESR